MEQPKFPFAADTVTKEDENKIVITLSSKKGFKDTFNQLGVIFNPASQNKDIGVVVGPW